MVGQSVYSRSDFQIAAIGLNPQEPSTVLTQTITAIGPTTSALAPSPHRSDHTMIEAIQTKASATNPRSAETFRRGRLGLRGHRQSKRRALPLMGSDRQCGALCQAGIEVGIIARLWRHTIAQPVANLSSLQPACRHRRPDGFVLSSEQRSYRHSFKSNPVTATSASRLHQHQ